MLRAAILAVLGMATPALSQVAIPENTYTGMDWEARPRAQVVFTRLAESLRIVSSPLCP